MLANLYKSNVLILILRNITAILTKISLIFENDLKNIAVTFPQYSFGNVIVNVTKREEI